MPEIPFATLNIISGYKKRPKSRIITQRQKTNKTILMPTWNSLLQTDCQAGTEGDAVYVPSGIIGGYFKIST
jgi:hypothetical protein